MTTSSCTPKQQQHVLSLHSTAGITGLLFSDRQEAGFGVNRMWYALGFTVGFMTSALLSVSAQQWFYIAVMFVSVLSYTLLIALTKKKWDFLPCCYSKPTVDDESNNSQPDIDTSGKQETKV